VGLEKKERFEVRSLKVGLVQLDRHAVINATQKSLLVATNRDALKLGGGRYNFEDSFELGALLQGQSIHFHGNI
jgi:hypothetical protein